MSEYQYYEWQTVDRIFTAEEQDAVNRLSSHMDASSSQAVEIKWRGRLSGKKELEKLAANARSLSARPWFISRLGFTQEALEFARHSGMLLSSQAELEALAKMVRT